MPRRFLPFLVVCTGLLGERAAFACSMAGNYQIPTNYELVAKSEAIVLAVAPTSAGASFVLQEVLKGSVTGELPRIQFGVPFEGASPESDFSKARPGAFSGACIAGDFRAGHLYVLFMTHGKNAWMIARVAFARVDEEVVSKDSPWVAAVRRYVEIASDPDSSHVSEKLRELQKLAAAAKDAASQSKYPKALIADIDRHFATPTPDKSAADLLRLYPKDPRNVLIALSVAHPEDGRALERKILADPHPNPNLQHAAIGLATVLHDSTAEPAAMRGIKSAGKDPLGKRWWWVRYLPQVADATQEADVLDTLEGSDDCEESAAIGSFWRRFPSEAGHAALAKKSAGNFEGCHQLAFVLARMGDRPVLDWAIHEVRTPHPHWVAGYVLGISPLPEAATSIAVVAATGSDEICDSVAQGLEYADPKLQAEHGRLLLERAKKSPTVAYWLHRALANARDCDCSEVVNAVPDAPEPPPVEVHP